LLFAGSLHHWRWSVALRAGRFQSAGADPFAPVDAGAPGVSRMLLIDTFVGPSPIEGVGVFAAEPIKAGQIIYRFEPGFDRLIRQDELALLPDPIKRFIDRYTYPHPAEAGVVVLDADNGRHMNHSESPNTDFRDAVIGRAIRDIAPGEEITCNYAEFEPGFTMLASMVAAHRTAGQAFHAQ
jgi:SET domain-containing protein